MTIRWLIRADVEQLLKWEAADLQGRDWSRDTFLQHLRQRNNIAMAAEDPKTRKILGYIIYSLKKNEYEIVRLAVAKEHRRAGLGAMLVTRLLNKLSQQRRRCVEVMVRETDHDQQYFYRALGFRAVALLREWYGDTAEDGYHMVYKA